jgi:hypothetical protein
VGRGELHTVESLLTQALRCPAAGSASQAIVTRGRQKATGNHSPAVSNKERLEVRALLRSRSAPL